MSFANISRGYSFLGSRSKPPSLPQIKAESLPASHRLLYSQVTIHVRYKPEQDTMTRAAYNTAMNKQGMNWRIVGIRCSRRRNNNHVGFSGRRKGSRERRLGVHYWTSIFEWLLEGLELIGHGLSMA